VSCSLSDLWIQDDSGLHQAAPLTDTLVASCEKALCVKLPRFFLELYRAQNGGCLRDVEDFFLHPLVAEPNAHGCVRLLSKYADNDEVLHGEDADWVREEVGDPRKLVVFWDEGHCCYALNYNDCGADGEPSVHYFDFIYKDDIEQYQAAATFEAFVKGMLPSDDSPIVDWEARNQLEVLAEETIVAHDAGVTQTVHQLLGRDGRNLVQFTRTLGGNVVEHLARTTISGKLQGVLATLRSYRPAPIASFQLILLPEKFDDIKTDTSTLGSSGKWKNTVARHVPDCVHFESKDRAKLEALRLRAFDGKLPQDLLAREELEAKMESMPVEQWNAVMPHLFLQSMQMLRRQQTDSGLPALEHIERVQAEELKRLQQRASDNPAVDPEILKLIEKMHGTEDTPE
jgi:hypothetical protein